MRHANLLWLALTLCGCQQGHRPTSPIIQSESPPPPAAAPQISPDDQQEISPPASQPLAPVQIVRPFEGVVVHLKDEDSQVEIQARTCLEAGWLEQIACSPMTREHESLMVVAARPSHIHAALLMAGFEPGSPGRWTYENDKLGTIDPTGEQLEVLVRYADSSGKMIEHSVARWIRDGAAAATSGISGQVEPQTEAKEFPNLPWVFSGSRIVPNPQNMGPGEHYVADMTGSIIGLVTFGDEVLGFSRVLADQADVQEPLWEANPDTMPPVETDVTIILRKWR